MTENRDTPFLMHENFRYRNFSETRSSPTNFFGSKDKKNSTEIRDIPLPLIHKFFR